MNKNPATAARHCAITVLLSTALLPLQAALAADILVSKFTDSLDGSCDSDCSLREAVQKANQTPGASRIVLAAGTYSLSIPPLLNPDLDDRLVDDDDNLNGDLDIKGQLTIVGRGIDTTTIDAGFIDRIAEALPGAVATLSKLTVRNGSEPYGGGGLWINGGASLALQSAAVTRSGTGGTQYGAGYGGGIANFGTLTIDASRVDGNSGDSGEGYLGLGGGIYNVGSLTVRDARFIGNYVSDEDSIGLGGALYNEGTADIRRASFENNGVDWYGHGAAIQNDRTGTLRLENSTVSGSNNKDEPSSNPLAAIENGSMASARLVNVTIAGNRLFGLTNRGRISIVNSIIAGNGPVENLDVGIEGKDQNCINLGTSFQFSQTGLLRGTDSGNCPSTLLVLNADSLVTLLYPLALNNWQSPTFALRPGSIAIDAAVGSCLGTDQRRVSRPRDGNGDGIAACDLGAYERPKP